MLPHHLNQHAKQHIHIISMLNVLLINVLVNIQFTKITTWCFISKEKVTEWNCALIEKKKWCYCHQIAKLELGDILWRTAPSPRLYNDDDLALTRHSNHPLSRAHRYTGSAGDRLDFINSQSDSDSAHWIWFWLILGSDYDTHTQKNVNMFQKQNTAFIFF